MASIEPLPADHRPRVLAIAESADPEGTSVPLVGWKHAEALREVADVHLVAQVRSREKIIRAGLVEGRDFTAIDSEWIARPLARAGRKLRGGRGKGWTTVSAIKALYYPFFERMVWKRFGHAIRGGAFDVVHRITPLSPTAPSFMATWCGRNGVPFVLGPLNGGVPWPRQFDRERRKEREWLSYIRGAHRLLPGYRRTRRDAAALIIASRDTLAQMPASCRDRCVYIPENGIDPSRFSRRVEGEVRLPLRVAFVGRLVPYKGPDMLIEAIAPLARAGRAVLDLIGDGPMMAELRQRVEREGLGDSVTLAGKVPHDQLQHRLVQSDVFAFPSIREFGGGVVLEAMALGLAPVIVDYAGPSELVTEETGFKVPIGSRQQIVERFRRVLSEMAERPAGLREVGERARRRVLDLFLWSVKARQTLEVYRWVMGQRPTRPDFGTPLDPVLHSRAIGPPVVSVGVGA